MSFKLNSIYHTEHTHTQHFFCVAHKVTNRREHTLHILIYHKSSIILILNLKWYTIKRYSVAFQEVSYQCFLVLSQCYWLHTAAPYELTLLNKMLFLLSCYCCCEIRTEIKLKRKSHKHSILLQIKSQVVRVLKQRVIVLLAWLTKVYYWAHSKCV